MPVAAACWWPGQKRPDVVELWDWTMAPGDIHGSEAHSPGTKELLQVQEGSISVVVAGEAFILEAGDAVSLSRRRRALAMAPWARNRPVSPWRSSNRAWDQDTGRRRRCVIWKRFRSS